MIFWTDRQDEQIRGFIEMKETSSYILEIYIMDVLKEFHRNNIGRELFEACYNYSREQGVLVFINQNCKKRIL